MDMEQIYPHIEFTSEAGIWDGEPSSYRTHIEGTIYLDEELRIPIGLIRAIAIHGDRAYWEGGGETGLWEVHDEFSGDLERLFHVVYKTDEDGWFGAVLPDMPNNLDNLYIDRISIHPQFRGKGLMEWAAQKVEDSFASYTGSVSMFTFPKLREKFLAMGYRDLAEPRLQDGSGCQNLDLLNGDAAAIGKPVANTQDKRVELPEIFFEGELKDLKVEPPFADENN